MGGKWNYAGICCRSSVASVHAFGRLHWRISLGHVKPLSSWLHVVAKSLDFYSVMMSAKAADPPNPGTFWAPDACTLIYKNGITAWQSCLDMEGSRDTARGGKWPYYHHNKQQCKLENDKCPSVTLCLFHFLYNDTPVGYILVHWSGMVSVTSWIVQTAVPHVTLCLGPLMKLASPIF